METAYLNYIAGDWKLEQEALKKDGQTISYKVVQTEPHWSIDWNSMLMTEYKDLARYEKNLEKAGSTVAAACPSPIPCRLLSGVFLKGELA